MKKVGIITYHCADNFGAVLQAYALMKKIEQLGFETEVIDFKPITITHEYSEKFDIGYSLKTHGLLRSIKGLLFRYKSRNELRARNENFIRFRSEHLNLSSDVYLTEVSLKEKSPIYDFYITGSDQVWNPDFFEKIGNSYFLNFGLTETTRISYAASISKDIGEEYSDFFKENLKRFNYISVREESSKVYLEDKTEKEVSVTLDPTLLMTKEDWIHIASHNDDENFILVYDLVKCPVIISIANKIAKEKEYKIISFSNGEGYINWNSSFCNVNPSDFLGLMEKAQVIVTSSFHGTVFALIFNKAFYTVPHPTRGNRMVELLNKLELSDRIVGDDSICIDLNTKINYNIVNAKLIELRYDSMEFIKTSLGIKK